MIPRGGDRKPEFLSTKITLLKMNCEQHGKNWSLKLTFLLEKVILGIRNVLRGISMLSGNLGLNGISGTQNTKTVLPDALVNFKP